mgnify:CR=1 FL=1
MTIINNRSSPEPFVSTREKSWFAFLPVTITYDGGSTKTKWLEKITVKQQYQVGGAADCGFAGWTNIDFI